MPNLKNRSIIEILGDDRKSFLQGLITNDINKASPNNLIYSAMLNATGRFLYDFFIFESDEKLVLDCSNLRRDEILKKLNFYKLRAKVNLRKNDELLVAQSFTQHHFVDPRNKEMGYRIYKTAAELSAIEKELMSEDFYNFNRIQNKIPESENDLTYEKSLILEFDFDSLNAINYEKGCYIGQELTARTHYKGEIRKKIFHIIIPQTQNNKVEKGSEISCEGKSVGIILSSSSHQNDLHALALVRLPDNLEEKNFTDKLEFQNRKILVIS